MEQYQLIIDSVIYYFRNDEKDFDSGYERLKSIFAEIKNKIPEYKYKFEPIYDCLKAQEDTNEISCFMDRQSKSFRSELETINMYNWHETHEFYG